MNPRVQGRRFQRIEWTAAIIVGWLGGCAHQPAPTTQPSLATTQPSYWRLDQPASVTVVDPDFFHLWEACEETARQFGWSLDREDYRAGVLTTVPLISKQWFEFWRNDVQTAKDLAESSLATYRRTLRFNVVRLADGRYQATPFIVIERYAQAERPVVASVYLRTAFRTERHEHSVGTAESDLGLLVPQRYWYATGRDIVVEKSVAKKLESLLAKK